MLVSVIIPAYNESRRIARSLGLIRAFLDARKFAYEIIVVDDGSIDATIESVERLSCPEVRVLRRAHQGKGAAVRAGVLAAQGEYILFTDADLSCPIEELDALLLRLRQGASIAIGSRALAGSRITVHQPLMREMMGKIFNYCVRHILGLEFHDTQCGFKLFRREAARILFSRQHLDDFCFDAEILYMARKMGFAVQEVPVSWANSALTKVNVISDPLVMFRDLFLIKRWHEHRRRCMPDRV